jgi:hypothetical protein
MWIFQYQVQYEVQYLGRLRTAIAYIAVEYIYEVGGRWTVRAIDVCQTRQISVYVAHDHNLPSLVLSFVMLRRGCDDIDIMSRMEVAFAIDDRVM